MNSLQDIFLYFIIYSFFGWLFEVAYAYTHQKKFVNRGFLHGPFCPLYGFSCVLLISLLEPFRNNLILLFIMSTLLSSAIEYITGLVLEKLFNQKWWDYTDDMFNLHGRICLLFSLIWGAAIILVMKLVHPIFTIIISFLPYKPTVYICTFFLCYFLIDGLITLLKLMNVYPSSNVKFD